MKKKFVLFSVLLIAAAFIISGCGKKTVEEKTRSAPKAIGGLQVLPAEDAPAATTSPAIAE
jgi:hypothetical protein